MVETKLDDNKQSSNLLVSIKKLRVDKFFNLLRCLKYELELYNNEHTQLSPGLIKELYSKMVKIARKISKAANKNDLLIPFIVKKKEFHEKIKNFRDLEEKYNQLLDIFEKCKENLISNMMRNGKEPSSSTYNRELKSYAKLNFLLAKQSKITSSIRRRELIAGYLFTMPALIFISIFVLFSVLYATWTSLNVVKVHGNGMIWKFVGFEQYSKVAHSPLFKRSLIVSLTYMGMVAPIQTIIALVLSSVLATKIKGNKAFLVIYFLPTLTSSTALTMIFVRLAGSGGPLETFLGAGFARKHILGLIAIMNIWSTVPLFITTFNAAHADIPKSQYEAMAIDGAGPIRKFFKITVPYLRPVTAYVLMMGVIGTLQMFDQAYMIAKDPAIGADSNNLITTAKYIFDLAFGPTLSGNDFGRASAAAIIFTLIILSFSIVSSLVSKPTGGK